MHDIKKEVGFNIRRIREEKGFSQKKLAPLVYVFSFTGGKNPVLSDS